MGAGWQSSGAGNGYPIYAIRLAGQSAQASQPDGTRPEDVARDQPCADPQVGIFWLVRHGAAAPVLLIEASHLVDAEPYGDCLTHPRAHIEVWEEWQRKGARWLEQNGFPPAVLQEEYEHFPRGRVVYEKSPEKFVIYADRRLHNREIISKLAEAMGLRNGSYRVMSDPHYRVP